MTSTVASDNNICYEWAQWKVAKKEKIDPERLSVGLRSNPLQKKIQIVLKGGKSSADVVLSDRLEFEKFKFSLVEEVHCENCQWLGQFVVIWDECDDDEDIDDGDGGFSPGFYNGLKEAMKKDRDNNDDEESSHDDADQHLEPHLPDIFPKKENFKLVKCKDHIELLADHNGVVQLVKTRNTEFVPTLRLLHKYPFIFPLQQVDKGAIRFLLNGSSIMCPGLTSPGAKMTPGVPVNTIVAIMAEGKEHAIAVGQMKMSSEEIAQVNKGIGIETVVYLNDGLWRLAEKPV